MYPLQSSAFHTISTNHNIDFENVRVSDIVNFKKQREFVEMLNIHFYPNTINRMEDTLFSRNNYKKIIDLNKKPSK